MTREGVEVRLVEFGKMMGLPTATGVEPVGVEAGLAEELVSAMKDEGSSSYSTSASSMTTPI